MLYSLPAPDEIYHVDGPVSEREPFRCDSRDVRIIINYWQKRYSAQWLRGDRETLKQKKTFKSEPELLINK